MLIGDYFLPFGAGERRGGWPWVGGKKVVAQSLGKAELNGRGQGLRLREQLSQANFGGNSFPKINFLHANKEARGVSWSLGLCFTCGKMNHLEPATRFVSSLEWWGGFNEAFRNQPPQEKSDKGRKWWCQSRTQKKVSSQEEGLTLMNWFDYREGHGYKFNYFCILVLLFCFWQDLCFTNYVFSFLLSTDSLFSLLVN